MVHDELGQRMKEQYEDRTRYMLPRRTYTIIRLDGKAFHTFTRDLDKPWDLHLVDVMKRTMQKLCEEIQGCVLGYTQSDEISLLLTDFNTDKTCAWFDGNLQKICSISASMATAWFNQLYNSTTEKREKMAFFDARAFTISDRVEVMNYFIWRQKDAVRNSISMLAQSLYSHKELHKKNVSDMQEMCFQKGKNWNDVPAGLKRGYTCFKETKVSGENVKKEWIVPTEENKVPHFKVEHFSFIDTVVPQIPDINFDRDSYNNKAIEQ